MSCLNTNVKRNIGLLWNIIKINYENGSSIGRICKCKFDGQSPIPDWTTIHNYSACIIGESEFIPGFPEVLCQILNLIVDDSADIDCTVDNDCHIDIEIRFHTSKKLVKDPTEKEGDKEIGRKRNNKK